MRYWPTINFGIGPVGKLVELPDNIETLIMVRNGLLIPETINKEKEKKNLI